MDANNQQLHEAIRRVSDSYTSALRDLCEPLVHSSFERFMLDRDHILEIAPPANYSCHRGKRGEVLLLDGKTIVERIVVKEEDLLDVDVLRSNPDMLRSVVDDMVWRYTLLARDLGLEGTKTLPTSSTLTNLSRPILWIKVEAFKLSAYVYGFAGYQTPDAVKKKGTK